MQRLNIPMKSGQSTTRRDRRVVWQVAGILLFGLVFLGCVRMLVGRTSLLSLAPEGATAVDIVGRGALADFSEHFSQIPLFPSRPVTFSTLAPSIRREVLWAFLPNGARVFAYRGDLDDTHVTLFQQYGLFVSQNEGVVILSDQVLSVTGHPKGRLGLSAALPHYAGMSLVDGKTLAIWKNADGFAFGGSPAVFSRPLHDLPASTIASVPFDASISQVSGYFQTLVGLGLSSEMQTVLAQHSGWLLLTHDDAGIGYRLQINAEVDSQALAGLIKSSLLLATPTTQTVTLSDGTLIDELHVDNGGGSIVVEELPEGSIIRADENDVHLRAKRIAQMTVITNRDALLDLTDETDTLNSTCGVGPGVYLRPQDLLGALGPTMSVGQVDPLWSEFSELLIYKGKMKFCW